MEDKKSVKRQAAEARQAEYDKMTDQQKLDRLDRMFGKDQGAAKERKKIAARMANPQSKLQHVRSEMSASRARPSQATTEEANAQTDRALSGETKKRTPLSIDDQLRMAGYDPMTGLQEKK
jgi:multidrug resistance efflux pump